MTSEKKSYEVDDVSQVQLPVGPGGERFTFDFTAGPHIPKSEAEEAALEHLVSIGAAKAPDGRRWRSPLTLSKEEKARLAAEAEAAKGAS